MTCRQTPTSLTEAESAARNRARGYTDADLAEAMDNPEWTEEQLRTAKPFAEMFPELAALVEKDRKAKD